MAAESRERPIRIVYNQSGTPTGALVDREAIFDKKLYWVRCKTLEEAHYLLGIINSDTLAEAVNKYTTPNWAGKTRDLEKHLWKLPIPEFDPKDSLHTDVSKAGEATALAAAQQLAQLREERDRVTVTIARSELRKWLRTSPEGQTVEEAVSKLLSQETEPRC